jgi:hypothetical protein
MRPVLSLIIGTVLLSYSCKKENLPCVFMNNTTDTLTMAVEDFADLIFELDGTLYLQQGEIREARLIGPSNAIDKIEFRKNSDGVMEIYSRRCLSGTEEISIYLTLPGLTGLTNLIEGNIICLDTFLLNKLVIDNRSNNSITFFGNLNELTIYNPGNGFVNLLGFTTILNIVNETSGNVHGFYMKSTACTAENYGSGLIETFATQKLEAIIRGDGNIYYKGTPIVESQITGNGELIKVD